MKVTCFECGKLLDFSSMPGRRDECPHCRADVHSCKNCKHYDRSAYNECREPIADVVTEKSRANFCDHYDVNGEIGRNSAPTAADLRAAAEALFKKKS